MSPQENLHKELDLIEAVISRMASNSFMIKRWAITLVSALFAFGQETIFDHEQGIYYLLMIFVILVAFWWLDAYYLKQEKIFRKIYEKAVDDPKASERKRYELNPSRAGVDVKKMPRAARIMWSVSILFFYLPFALLLILGIVLKCIII